MNHLPKVYVLGTTNSGKSSLINAMLLKQTKYESKKTKESPLLTESALPGTTQEMITVEQFNIGFRVIDTPGIPNMNQVSARVNHFEDLKRLMPGSEMTTYPFNVK
jgi:ribosome biogenesis GTPase A